MNQHRRISYIVIAVLVILVAGLHLGTFLLAALFGYLALQTFCIGGRKWLSITFYVIAVIAVGAGLVYFSNLAYRTFPKIAQTAIPAIVGFAEKNGIELPCTDYQS